MIREYTNFYQAGGTLRPDAPCYVERAADGELFEALERGEFCCVLTSRQMGKSSLMVRTQARLKSQGIHVAVIDLTALGENQTAEQWYEGLLGILGQRLDLEDELEAFWLAHEGVGPLRRWMRAVREVVLPRLGAQCPVPSAQPEGESFCSGEHDGAFAGHRALGTGHSRLVIFFDEIECVRNLPFSTDEFFAAIRECYNQRSQDTAFERLTFCLLGVATPSDLIRDSRKTPFNIGRRIDLNDFTEAEAGALALGLAANGEKGRQGEGESRALLERILYWTGGHPYLTQRLCQAIAEARSLAPSLSHSLAPSDVDRLCEELFLSRRARERDTNLLFVRERVLRSEVDLAGLLELYGRVSGGRRLPVDDTSPLADVLRLAGIVRTADVRPFGRSGGLEVRNRIYASVFDQQWVAAHMPDAELRRQRAAYRRGLVRAASVATVVLVIMMGLVLTALNKTFQAEAATEQAAISAQLANERSDKLQAVKLDLEAKRAALEEALAEKTAQTNRANRETRRAEEAKSAESVQRRRAERQRQIARAQQARAERERRRAEQQRAENRRQLVRLNVANGTRLMEAGDLLGALPWLAEALALEEDSSRTPTHRLRLAAVLQRCPKLTQIWFHGGLIKRVAFSPDGRRVLTASNDGTARVWDVSTGAALTPPLRHANKVNTAAFSPDGRRVVTASEDRTARVWEAVTGAPVTPALRHAGNVLSAVFSPDGRRVLTASEDRTARMWDATTGEAIASPLEHKNRVSVARFSPDGGRILTTSDDGAVQVWETATGRPAGWSLKLLDRSIGFIGAAFSPDGRRIVTTNSSREARVWDTATGVEVTPALRMRKGLRVGGAVFSPDGRHIVTAGRDGLALWDAATGAATSAFISPEKAAGFLAFSPDGRRIVTKGTDGAARLLDAATGEAVLPPLQHGGAVDDAAFSPDGRQLVTAGEDGCARVWDLAASEPSAIPLPDSFGAASFSPDGRRIVTATGWGWARVRDAVTGEAVLPPFKHAGGVVFAAFSPDSARVVTASGDGTAQVWDAATGRRLTRPLEHGTLVRRAAFSPDGRRIVTVSGDNSARIWDAATGRPVTSPLLHQGFIHHAAFSPDSRRLVTASEDRMAVVWDAVTGRPVLRLPRHPEAVRHAEFSPNGRRIVTAGPDGIVRVWDAHTGRPAGPMLAHDGWVAHARFSPDGRRLVTAGSDTAQVWDVAMGVPITLPMKDSAQIEDAIFSRDGQRLVTTNRGSTAQVWDATTGELLTPPLKHGGAVNAVSFSPDGRRIATAAGFPGGSGWLWELPYDARPVTGLVRLARVLSAHWIHPITGYVPLPQSDLRAAWQALHTSSPRDRAATPSQVIAWHRREAEAAGAADEPTAAITHLGRALAARPAEAALFALRAHAYTALAGRERTGSDAARAAWQKAAADAARAVMLGSDDHTVWYDDALLRLWLGDNDGYRAACGRMLDRLQPEELSPATEFVLAVGTLAPNAAPVTERLATLARRQAAGPPPGGGNRLLLGAALYRAGRYAEALPLLGAALEGRSADPAAAGDAGSGFSAFFLAMCHQRLGNTAEARRWLDQANAWSKALPSADLVAFPRRPSFRRSSLELQILQREAEALMGQ